MCLHASRSRIAQTACFAQCTSQCTATKRCKYHSIGVFFGQLTQIQELFFRFLTILVKTCGIVSWPCSVAFTVACTVRALYVHCACTVRALCTTGWYVFPCIFISGALLFFSAVKATVRLAWGFGRCTTDFIQVCACTSINEKIFMLLLCSWVAALKMFLFLVSGFGKCNRDFFKFVFAYP